MLRNVPQPHLIKFKCSSCKRDNYFSRKNKKKIEKRLELKKYCKWCRRHTGHKEAKKLTE